MFLSFDRQLFHFNIDGVTNILVNRSNTFFLSDPVYHENCNTIE